MRIRKSIRGVLVTLLQIFVIATVLTLAHGGANAKADSDIQITGTVTNSSNSDVMGVSVYATNPGGSTVEYGPVTTGTGGAYDLPVAPGTYDFHFDPPSGQGLSSIVDSNVTVLSSQTISVQFSPAQYTLSGVITDSNGTPLSNIDVILNNGAEGETNASGQYSITTSSGYYSLGLSGNFDGIGMSTTQNGAVDLSDGNAIQNIEIPITTIPITVEDASGNPLPDVSVSGYNEGGSSTFFPGDGGEQLLQVNSGATTNASGVAYFPSIVGATYTADGPNSYTICAYYNEAQQCLTTPITVTANMTGIVLVEPQLGTLSGTLTDSNGNPLSNVYVYLSAGADGFDITGGETDANGQFSLMAPPANYTINITGEFDDISMLAVQEGSLNWGSGNITQNLQIPITTIPITVEDASGNPLPDVSVSGYNEGGSSTFYPGDGGDQLLQVNSDATTNASGVAYFPSIVGATYSADGPNTNTVCATFSVVNVSQCLSTPLTVTANTAGVVLIEPQLSTFSGTLTDGNGNPLSNVYIDLTAGTNGAGVAEGETNSSGQFSITAPAASYYSILIEANFDGINNMLAVQDGSVNMANGNITQNLQIPTTTIPITVVDAYGNPMPNVSVEGSNEAGTTNFYPGDGGEQLLQVNSDATTNADGIAYLSSIVGTTYSNDGPNSYTICAQLGDSQECLANPLTVTANTNSIILVDSAATSLPAPANLTAASPTTTAPALTWSSIDGATSYNIYRNGTNIGSSTTPSYTDTTASAGNTYSYYVTAVNSVGESAPSNSVSVVYNYNPNTPPAITSPQIDHINARDVTNFTVTTTGTPAPSITESGTLPPGITFQDNGDGTATFSGQASPTNDGYYFMTLTATNSAGSASQNFIMTVNDAQEVPTIISANTDTESYGVPFSFTVNTTGDPLPNITKVDGSGALPAGVKLKDNNDGTATLSGELMNASDSGTYTFTIQAKNKNGTATQVFTLIITKTPVIKNISSKTATIGTAYTQTVTASGDPTPSMTVAGFPAGLSYADNGNGTATITGTPEVGTAGTYTITVTASNDLGSTNASYILKVKN